MRMNKREKGAQKEEQVCACLFSKGVKIVERNFRNRQGEIDVIGAYFASSKVERKASIR